ncbi:TIGR03862 family flavoprotein [Rhizobium sp. CG5]|uniref:TIGR03862 family flavoprotein n=1 Tax=Rhizobium sp. CG5 TaxID=2726076 RepID=UPI0020333692|nr:TIGR03862 family flavoprotein [Rhizobium sp. CG5]MCM2477193.1 TIGR03862 family flavoprotein [Rhizobium sp. CG5]
MTPKQIAIVGGGPAGLMAADILSAAGHRVTVYESMPTVGRKFLLAGKSGLNLTHSEDYDVFASRFGAAGARLRPALDGLPPEDIRAWAAALGTETFVGTSGRVFPKAMKASPLLRAWLARLESQGLVIRTRHRWTGWRNGALSFETPHGTLMIEPDATLLALGGASWPRLGSDAAWTAWLSARSIDIKAFRPANCGFDVAWSDLFRQRFAGAPIKSVTASSPAGTMSGEFVVTETGIEGSLVYAHAAALRDQLESSGQAALILDFVPGRTAERLEADLSRQDSKASFANRLRKGAGLDGVKAAMLRDIMPEANRLQPDALAKRLKTLPLPVLRCRPIAEAISSAGGVAWAGVDERYMLKTAPGVFVAGEMLDWEAPTGGYLLTSCLATGKAAAIGIEAWLHI